MTARLILMALVAAATLSGCGRRGDLDRPAPLWGDRAKAEYEAEQRARQQQAQPETPAPAARRVDPATRNVPATQEPVDGSSDPVGDRPDLDGPG